MNEFEAMKAELALLKLDIKSAQEIVLANLDGLKLIAVDGFNQRPLNTAITKIEAAMALLSL